MVSVVAAFKSVVMAATLMRPGAGDSAQFTPRTIGYLVEGVNRAGATVTMVEAYPCGRLGCLHPGLVAGKFAALERMRRCSSPARLDIHMKLWTVWLNYLATGEGHTIMARVGYAENAQEAIAGFAKDFGEYFAKGAEVMEGVQKNDVTSRCSHPPL